MTRVFLLSLGRNPEDFNLAAMPDVDTMKAHLSAMALFQGKLILEFPDESSDGLAQVADVSWVK